MNINSVAVAKFFYIIYDAIFISLFGGDEIKQGLLGPISNYYDIIEMNGHEIFYLHCFVWLKSVLHLAILQIQL